MTERVRPTIVWFRRDLRLADNLALADALARANTIVPVFVLPADTDETGSGPGRDSASRAWLERSLTALDASLRDRGSQLVVREGPPERSLPELAHETGARLVTCTRDENPAARMVEGAVAHALAEAGIEFACHDGSLLVEPGSLTAASGHPYRVFTPFFRAWEHAWRPSAELAAPDRVPGPATWPASLPVTTPASTSPHAGSAAWMPGEAAARARLTEFAHEALADYDEGRDFPALEATSRLSPHLAFGEISPARVAAEVLAASGPDVARPFLRQLAWREFAYHVLADFPDLADRPWRAEYAAFPWRESGADFDAWRLGQTGFPLVDAGMRELTRTGSMHNRVRLVVASFLVKDLLVPWQEGERYFREALADYDPAANAFNWQWVAGSGADAAPYFRIFNPATQGERFDPDGAYTRSWVPELAGLPARWIHQPWKAPPAELDAAGIRLGTTYPTPLVDHAEARSRALAALEAVRLGRGA